ncbi:MAG: tetratricopeptide repeat protein [Deltaproteobacteria bacterium]|nr:tetratricopeptide repeat protein [Deltaproteobacteria bacterium]MBW2137425.1 tetratricopeptide repeat protein [Deltaproteobacteria bacterium]
MAKKKKSRKELLKEPDEFLTLSARAIIAAREHARKLKFLGMAVVAVVLVYLGASTYLKYANRKGQEAYNEAYNALVSTLDDKGQKAEGLARAEELLRKVIDEHGLSRARDLALPELGYVNFREGKYDEAISLYQSYLEEVPDDWYYRSLVSFALASCYEAKGDVKKAVEVLESVLVGPDVFLKGQAMLSLSRLYDLLNRDEMALKILKEFSEKFPSSAYIPFVKARLLAFSP